MAFLAPALCVPATILGFTVKWLGIADPNTPDGSAVVAGSPYTLQQVKDLILQSDFEIAQMIAAALGHPYRPMFLTEDSGNLANGALIPPHIGPHSRVMVKVGNADAVLGLVRTFERLKYIREHFVVHGSPMTIYAIHAGRIWLAADTGITASLDAPLVTKHTDFSALNCPVVYQWGVIAGAIVKAGMQGFNEAHRTYWANQWAIYGNEINGGALSLPKPEQMERLET